MQCKWSSRGKIYPTLTIYIMGIRNQRRGLRKLREWKTERMKESKKFLSCLGDTYYKGWETFL